jgi:hypothetical protein
MALAERLRSWAEQIAHDLRKRWWWPFIGVPLAFIWELVKDRVLTATNNFIDSHANLDWLKPLALLLQNRGFVPALLLTLTFALLIILGLIVHAYFETRPKRGITGEIQQAYAEPNFGTIRDLPDFDCAVVIKAHVVNASNAVTIKNYRCSVKSGGKEHSSDVLTLPSNWQRAKEEAAPGTYLGTHTNFYTVAPELREVIGRNLMVKGEGKEGWMAFLFIGLQPEETRHGAINLHLIDSFGTEHTVSRQGLAEDGKLIETNWG